MATEPTHQAPGALMSTEFAATALIAAALFLRFRKRTLPAGARAPRVGPTQAQIHRAIVGMLASERASRDVGLTQTIARAIHDACATEDMDPALLLASGYTESRFNPVVVSSVNARGIWQQLPQYGQYYADGCWDDSTHDPGCTWSQAADRPQNIDLYSNDIPQAARIAARHFGYLIRKYGFDNAICRYAAGGRGADCRAGGDYMRRLKERMQWARTFYGPPT